MKVTKESTNYMQVKVTNWIRKKAIMFNAVIPRWSFSPRKVLH